MKPRAFLPAITTGVLLWAAFFPLDLGPVAFVALVPWLTLVRAPVANRRRYFAAYLGGVVFFLLATEWIRVAHPAMYASWLGLTLVMPLFWLASLAIIRQFDRLGVPLALSAPVGWVALEYFRMHFPTGFPFMKLIHAYQMIGFGWYFLGYSQHEFAQLIQIADLGGVYAVTFVVAAINGALADVAMRMGAVQRWLRWGGVEPTPQPPPCREGESASGGSADAPRGVTEPTCVASSSPSLQGGGRGVGSLAGLLTAFTLLLASIGYGFYRLDHPAFADGPRVAAIQGNFEQGEKMGERARLRFAYYKLHEAAFREESRPDLIVWPETCQPVDWYEPAPEARSKLMPFEVADHWKIAQDELLRVDWGAPVLFGLNGIDWDGEREWKYNSAVLFTPLPRNPMAKPDDPTLFRSAFAGRYDKMHLVPFGEYVPLGDQLPFLAWFTPYEKGYECRPGERWTRFPLKLKDGREFTFSCLICYEDSDPYIARQYVAAEPVSFQVNISNDGWFNGTEEHEQHLAICRFRAIESRRSVVRAVNMGISGVIDPDGRVIALPRLALHEPGKSEREERVRLNEQPQSTWSESKKIDGVATAVVPIDNRQSLYAKFGDWVPATCWTAVLVLLVLSMRKKPAA